MSKQTHKEPTGGGDHPNDRVSALSGLYQGEKTDASSIFNAAMAMMAAAVAYLVGALSFVDRLSQGPFGWLSLVLLPTPLWLVVAFHSLITLNAMRHGISVKIIEDGLFKASGLPEEKRDLVGSKAGDKIMDISQAKAIHIVTTFVAYGGVLALVILFTVYALHSANGTMKSVWFRALVIWIAGVTYALLLIMVGISWMVGLQMIFKVRNEDKRG